MQSEQNTTMSSLLTEGLNTDPIEEELFKKQDEAEKELDSHPIIFDCKKVNLSYGNHHVLKDIDLQIRKNTVMAFIGPSGCGKSTFLRCLDRLNDLIPDCHITGKIEYLGKDINSYHPMVLRTIVGMVFQQPNPFPMSIYDNIAYGPRCQGIRKRAILDQIVEQSLRKASLWDEVKDRLKESAIGMSGGQQQRLCIARAIAMEPDVILMDEPTSALDPIATKKIEDLIGELKKDYTIIIVTHNMQQASRISDYTAFFMLGDLIECNYTSEIFSHPKMEKTKDYITGRFG